MTENSKHTPEAEELRLRDELGALRRQYASDRTENIANIVILAVRLSRHADDQPCTPEELVRLRALIDVTGSGRPPFPLDAPDFGERLFYLIASYTALIKKPRRITLPRAWWSKVQEFCRADPDWPNNWEDFRHKVLLRAH